MIIITLRMEEMYFLNEVGNRKKFQTIISTGIK